MQIHELSHHVVTIPVLNEGLPQTIKALFSQDPKLAGLSLAAKKAYFTSNKAIDNIADKAVNAWGAYVVNKLRQTPTYLQNQQQYRNDLRLFVQKNLLPPYTTVDQMTNKTQLYQVIDQIVANRADSQGNPAPKQQTDDFNKLVDLASVAMVTQPPQNPRARGQKQAGQAVQPGTATAQPAQTQFTPQAFQQFLQNFGMSAQQVAMLSQGLQQAAGGNTVNSTGNAAIDNLLQGLGFNVK